MKHNRKFSFIMLLVVISFISLQLSCTHDPFILDMDIEMEMDTTIIDSSMINEPCDSTIIYFNTDILPILHSSCAFSGCHDAASASDGVILDTYENVIYTAKVVPFNLIESELYEAITENDPDDMMPPSGKLDNTLIERIAEWILQGAENTECVESCISTDVTYSGYVQDVLLTSCSSCHSASTAFGNVILDNYEDVSIEVENGRLLGTINWEIGFKQMPQGQSQLDSCTISNIKKWIDEGALDN